MGWDDWVVRHIYRVERAIVAAAKGPAAEHPRDLDARPAVRLATYVPSCVELTGTAGDTYLLHQKATFTTDNL